MPEEYALTPEYAPEPEYQPAPPRYSSFWPQFILMIGFVIWAGYQLYAVNSQRIAIDQQYQALEPVLQPAKNAQDKLYALAQDLVQVAAKDSYAAQIVKEANIRIKSPENGAAAPTVSQ